MQSKTLTIAVVALLAFGASGVVAATTPSSPLATTAVQSPANTVSPTNHTVDVVDPDNKLSEKQVDHARQLAWGNQTVKQHVNSETSIHFHIEAVGDELEVYVASNSTATPRAQAVVDLDSNSVIDVTELKNVITAEEMNTTQVDSFNSTNDGEEEGMTVNAGSERVTVVGDNK